jgi:uncharacterized protein (TIGR00369 family)
MTPPSGAAGRPYPTHPPTRPETSVTAPRDSDNPRELDFALAAKLLDAQPFTRLVGARLTEFGDSAATIEVDIRPELHQQNGFLHGGVLSYAADNALTFAGGAVLGAAVLTGGFSIQFVRPATGRTLIARAQVVHGGRRQAVVRCDLSTADEEGTEKLCAVAQGTVLSVAQG